ncbi:MAG TPA: YbaK/EbsC family protein [Deltaproteobacteria bacterium]|mgnify:CR=1 FL=1|nr:YbaK/EbsC family protein [Deltaproteobacteria bacterium]
MKKAKPAKKKASVKKRKAAKKASAPKKKKTAAKKVNAKKKAVKKTPAKKKAKATKKPVKKGKATKKAKVAKKKAAPKKKKVIKKTAAKKAKIVKKAASQKVKVAKKALVKKPAAAKPKVEKVSLPSTRAIDDLQRQMAVFTVCSCQLEGPSTTAKVAAQLGVDEHCVIKTMVLEDEFGKPMLVLIPGDQEISLEELAATIGAQQVSLCSAELAEVHTGYESDATSPFGIQKVMPVFMEKSVAMMPEIYLGAGKRGLFAKMSPDEVIDKLKPFMVSVTK